MRTYNVVICLHSRLIWITSLTHSSTSYWTRETFTQETRSEWRICLVPVEVIGKQPTLTCHVLVLQLLASLASTQETSANFQVASQLNKKLYWGVKIIPCSKLNCLVKVNQKYWKIVIANYFLQFIRYIYIYVYIYTYTWSVFSCKDTDKSTVFCIRNNRTRRIIHAKGPTCWKFPGLKQLQTWTTWRRKRDLILLKESMCQNHVRMFDVWIHRVCAFAVFFLSRYRYDATCE